MRDFFVRLFRVCFGCKPKTNGYIFSEHIKKHGFERVRAAEGMVYFKNKDGIKMFLDAVKKEVHIFDADKKLIAKLSFIPNSNTFTDIFLTHTLQK